MEPINEQSSYRITVCMRYLSNTTINYKWNEQAQQNLVWLFAIYLWFVGTVINIDDDAQILYMQNDATNLSSHNINSSNDA